MDTPRTELKPDAQGFRYVLMWINHLLEHKDDADASYLIEWRDFIQSAQAQIAALHERLEDNFCFNDKGKRIKVEPGSIPDGISCRDETIKLLESQLAALEQKRRESLP